MRKIALLFLRAAGFLLSLVLRFVKDRTTPERIGIDRPELFERILMKLFRYRDITATVDGVRVLYMRRFFLTPRRWPLRIFLHHIVRSDSDRDCHDHPFDFATYLVRGSYLERIRNPFGTAFYGWRFAQRGSLLDNKAEHTHKVELDEPVWSLLLVSRARRAWGFWTENGWVDWRTYLGAEGDEDSPEDRIKAA